MAPFHLQYTLSRRQRLATELFPWLPALAGSLGYVIGLAVLAVEVSPWFLLFLILPLTFYRGLVVLLLDLAFRSAKPVEILVEGTSLEILASGERLGPPLAGIIQVFPSGGAWTVLHLNGAALTIPATAITDEQIDYLKSFARTAAEERKAARSGS